MKVRFSPLEQFLRGQPTEERYVYLYETPLQTLSVA